MDAQDPVHIGIMKLAMLTCSVKVAITFSLALLFLGGACFTKLSSNKLEKLFS